MKIPGFHLPDTIMSFLMRKCIPIYTVPPSVGFGQELLVSVLYLCRPDSGVCGSVVPMEGQDWTATARFNLGKEDVLVLFGPVDYLWFVRRAGRLLHRSVLSLLLHISRSRVWMDTHNRFPDFFSGNFPTSFQMQAPSLL